MKLIIQMPCLNEAETIEVALSALPRQVDGFDEVEWLIVNDGSTDNTVEVAKSNGVDHIVNFTHNQGLAKAFMAGIEKSLELGADVIVNTDADNQYNADDIPSLVAPILDGTAEYVIGARPIQNTEHFSDIKKYLQKLGSWVVRIASATDIPDAPSGFRAIKRECAKELNVYSEYTYTLETIIQAGRKNMTVASVPIRTNEDLRPSRLLSSIPNYIKKSVITIVRIFVVYQPFKFFMSIAGIIMSLGFILGLRFLYYFFIGEGDGHIQSVILAGALIVIGFQTGLIAFVADLLSVNRQLLEKLRVKKTNS